MGTPGFAVEPLRALLAAGCNVVAVITVADKPAGRGLKLRQSDVKKFAVENNLPVYQPEKLKDEQWIETYASLNIDLAVVVAFRMLPKVIWDMPRLGTFNLHASLLPRYRGAAPINWAIINGDRTTGVTTFFLDSKIDCGEIIGSMEVPIDEHDSAGTLHDKLMVVGSELVVQTVDRIASGCATRTSQPVLEDELRGQAPKIFRADCQIDWSLSAKATYDKIRGLSPYPAAWCELSSATAKIFEAHYLLEDHGCEIGAVESTESHEIRVAVCDGWVYIDRLQMAGAKKPLSSVEFLRGNKL